MPGPSSSENPYAVLGIAPHADDVVVRAAWKALVRKYHPDTSTEPDAQARTVAINAAFTLIGKPEARAAYDRARRQQSAPPPPRPAPPRPSYSYTPRPPSRPKLRHKLFAIAMALAAILLIARMAGYLPLPDRVENALTRLRESDDPLEGLRRRLRARLGLEPSPVILAAPEAPAPRAAPPPVDPAIIAAAVNDFERLLRTAGMPATISQSRTCAATAKDWPAQDRCTAFDIAGEAASGALGGTSGRYFSNAVTQATQRYAPLTDDANAIGQRLDRIRAAAWPDMIDRIGNGLRTPEERR